MIKTKKFVFPCVSLFVAICLCIGIGAGLINGNEKGVSIVGNGIQSTSSIPEGARPIASLSDFNSWLNMEVSDNQAYKYGYLVENITADNLDWGKDISNVSWTLAEGRTFNGNGKTLTIIPTNSNFELNYDGINKAYFMDVNYGTISDVTINTGGALDALKPKKNTYVNLGIISGVNYGAIIGCTSNINHMVKLYVGTGPDWSEHRLGGITGSNAGGAINYCTVNMNDGGVLHNDVYGGKNWSTRYNGNGETGCIAGVTGSSDTNKIGEIINNTINWNGGKIETQVQGDGNRWHYVGLAAGRRKHETSTSNDTDGSQTYVNGIISNGTMPAIGANGYTTMNSIVTPNGAPEYNSNIYIDDNSVAGLTIKGDNTGDNFIYNINKNTLYFDTDSSTREANRNKVFVTADCGNNEIIYSANGKKAFLLWDKQSPDLSAGQRNAAVEKDDPKVNETKDFTILSGKVETAEVGYIGEDKTYDGVALSVNNPKGLNLSGEQNPINAGTYSISIIETETGIAYNDAIHCSKECRIELKSGRRTCL